MGVRYCLGLARVWGGHSWSPLPASHPRSRVIAT
jgi:hypothetical protein